MSKTKSVENAIILSDIFVSFYTCVETAFFRISQFFENTLDQQRWHRDVLKKMTLTIRGIRERVISEDIYHELEELLRFRHFKRYYFEFDYDWDRLELVRTKFLSVRRRVIAALKDYQDYLEALAECLDIDKLIDLLAIHAALNNNEEGAITGGSGETDFGHGLSCHKRHPLTGEKRHLLSIGRVC